MLLEEVTVPRLASTHLPALHPDKIIFPFFLCLNSDLLLPEGWRGAKAEAAGVGWGQWCPVPVARAAVGALGLLVVFLALCSFARSATHVPR